MELSVISFTEAGIALSRTVAEQWKDGTVSLYTKCSRYQEVQTEELVYVTEPIGEWAGRQMQERRALLFIGACGIAVRAIAPHIVSKLYDSPVLVMDERGQYVIPLLAGHMGGANELAGELAERMGVVPVITTATDIQRRFAVDMFAKHNGLHIKRKETIARISSKVLAGEEVTLSVETGHMQEGAVCPRGIRLVEYPPREGVDILVSSEGKEFPAQMLLQPKEYVIGMGCRKGKEAEAIEELIQRVLDEQQIGLEQVSLLASVDVKKEEAGFLTWSRKHRVPFVTFTAQELKEQEGIFHTSAFVEEQIGIGNVCERAALKACKWGGHLVAEKCAENGMTIAIAKRDWRVTFDEE